MSAWRRRALSAFPGLRHELQNQKYSYYQLFFDLLPIAREAHASDDTALLDAVYGYATWCLNQRRRASDLANAAAVAFYEHLFDQQQEDWVAVLSRLSKDAINECLLLWDERWPQLERRFGSRPVRELRKAIQRRMSTHSGCS